MPFEPGQSGNPSGRPKAEKAFANMLRIAIKEAHDEGRDKLRAVADALVSKAITGDVPAINSIAERLDGKVPQAIVGDDDHDPISVKARLDAEHFTKGILAQIARASQSATDAPDGDAG